MGRNGNSGEDGAGNNRLSLLSALRSLFNSIKTDKPAADLRLREVSRDRGAVEKFSKDLLKARKTVPFGCCVDAKSPEDLKGSLVFYAAGGNAGCAVTPDGDIVAVFNSKAGVKGANFDLMLAALTAGGEKLDCYTGGLERIYCRYGMLPACRLAFNPEYVSAEDMALFKRDFGTDDPAELPPVVMFYHNGDAPETVAEKAARKERDGGYHIITKDEIAALPVFTDYGEALAYRDKLLAERKAEAAETEDDEALAERLAEEDMRAEGWLNEETEAEFGESAPQRGAWSTAGDAFSEKPLTPEEERLEEVDRLKNLLLRSADGSIGWGDLRGQIGKDENGDCGYCIIGKDGTAGPDVVDKSWTLEDAAYACADALIPADWRSYHSTRGVGRDVLYQSGEADFDEISEEQEKDIREAYDYVMNGEPVARLTGEEFQKDGVPLTEKVTLFYREQYDGKAVNPELGEVKLDAEGVKDSLGHGIGRIKAAAYAAVPQMIEKGKIFDRQKNRKGRGYDTVVIAAPLEIGGLPYAGEVIVKQHGKRQGFYLHEVEVKEKLADAFKTPTEGSAPPASKLIIAQLIEKVKSKPNKKANTETVEQSFGSAGTSLRQVAAGLKKIAFKSGTSNLDLGGGRFNEGTEYLAEKGVKSIVFDPFNRNAEENSAALDAVKNGGFDTVTCNNVLNVIKEPEVRSNVVLQAAKALKPDGTAYFTMYEGDKSGNGRQTKSDSWQNNRETADYIKEIQEHFGEVTLRNRVITAKNPLTEGKTAVWQLDDTFTNSVRYSPAGGGSARGATEFSGKLSDGTFRAIISLFNGKGADKRSRADGSTIIHELAHWTFRLMEEMVKNGFADDRMKADFARLQAWLDRTGKDDSADPAERAVARDERLARGFEAYLREGAAPSVKLAAAFGTLSAMLKNIYRSALALRAPIDAEVRMIFDGMIASDDTVAYSRLVSDMLAQIDPGLLGTSNGEARVLRELILRAREQAANALDREKEARMRELRPGWRELARQARENDPLMILQDELLDGDKLDFTETAAIAGEGAALALHERGLTSRPGRIKKDGTRGKSGAGIHPAEVAAAHFAQNLCFMKSVMLYFFSWKERCFHETFIRCPVRSDVLRPVRLRTLGYPRRLPRGNTRHQRRYF